MEGLSCFSVNLTMNRFCLEGVGLSRRAGECWIKVVSSETRGGSVTDGVCEDCFFFISNGWSI